jgi:hypothetical protein
MPSNIIVNNMTTQHKLSTGITAAFPDVCKTPTPAGPVPIPYPNIANSIMASKKVSKRVKDNKQNVVVKGASYMLSNGDQAGVALGVKSNKIMGESVIKNQSFDVKFEGKGTGRLGDPHGNNAAGANFNTVAPMEGQPPMMGMGGSGDSAACDQLKKNQVPPDQRAAAAEKCGMRPDHAEGMSKACKDSGRSASFRSTNKESGKWIDKGHPAKGTDIKEKSISPKTIDKLENPSHASTIADMGLEGLVGSYDSSGKLTGVRTTTGSVGFDEVSRNGVPPNAYTGDYDAHDMFDSDGSRIRDGSKAETDFRRDLNQGAGRGKGARKEMVRHGPQNNYSDYVKNNKLGKPHPIASLQLPDVSKEEPLLVLDGNGEMYLIDNEDDLRLYYACKGAKVPEEWDPPKRQEVEQRANKGKAPAKKKKKTRGRGRKK